jgi:hypothetical protein
MHVPRAGAVLHEKAVWKQSHRVCRRNLRRSYPLLGYTYGHNKDAHRLTDPCSSATTQAFFSELVFVVYNSGCVIPVLRVTINTITTHVRDMGSGLQPHAYVRTCLAAVSDTKRSRREDGRERAVQTEQSRVNAAPRESWSSTRRPRTAVVVVKRRQHTRTRTPSITRQPRCASRGRERPHITTLLLYSILHLSLNICYV